MLATAKTEEITGTLAKGILTSEMVTDSTSTALVSHGAVLWGCPRPEKAVTRDDTVLGAQKERERDSERR